MATVDDIDKKDIQSFIESLLDPKPLDSIETLKELKVLLYESETAPPRELPPIRSMYPFMTVLDLKLAIYDMLKMDDRALPDFMFIGKLNVVGKRILPIEYTWSMPQTPMSKVSLYLPFSLAAGKRQVDERFVESSGARQQLGRTELDRVTLEDKYIGSDIPVLHVYLYSAVEQAVKGPRPISEHDWNGRLYPYFPVLSVGNDKPTDQQRKTARILLKGFLRKRQFLMKLNAIMTGGDPIYYVSLKSIISLLLTFPTPAVIPGIEKIFYTIPVNDRRPYMRLLPVEGDAISKVHMMADGSDRPNIEDPSLLYQWSQERNPTPERDFAIVKILIRKAVGNVKPIYITMRLYDDGTSDITIEPSKGEAKLDPDIDLEGLPVGITSALQGFTYIKENPILSSGRFVFDINLKDVVLTKYTTDSLRSKLPLFSAIFQEIAPIPGENPTIMLRYKLVTNFYREDRIQAFITQIQSRKSSKGESYLADLPDLVAEEFQLSKDKARKYVEKKLQGASDIVVTNLEPRDYSLYNNPGIDIAVFAEKHPIYTFKVYSVNSYINLQRIMTFLSLLMSIPERDLQIPVEHVEELKSAERLSAGTENAFENVEEEAPVEAEEEAPVEAEEAQEAEEAPVEAEEEAPVEAEEGFENVPEEGFENVIENVPEGLAEQGEPPDELPDYLLNFANEELTLEEAHAMEEVAEAVAVEGEAIPEGLTDQAPEVARNSRTVLHDFKEDVEETTRASLAGPEPVKKFKIKPKAPEAPAPAAAPAPPIDDPSKREKGLEKYFSDRLKEADARLFEFKQTDGSAKTKYVVQCASNLMRQPAVLNEAEFQRMRDVYKDVLDSGEITFYLFPLDKDKKKAPYDSDRKKENYSIMKFGSSPKNQNYYICCKFFCIRDVIMVREKELLGTKLRRPVKRADGTMRTTKEPNTCPFCEGLVVKNKRFPGTNEVVLERKPNTGSGRHLSIRFLKKTNHPEGFYLPCCFLEDQPIRIGQHPAFPEPSQDLYTSIAAPEIQDQGEEGEEGEEEDEGRAVTPEDSEDVSELDKIMVSYEGTLLTARTASIVGSEKLPLDPAMKMIRKKRRDKKTGLLIDDSEDEMEDGVPKPPKISPPQIGLLPPQLNEYFSQETTDIVSRTFNPQKLNPNSRGFIRIGVQNATRYRNDSFLAAIAIYFLKMNSVKEFKDELYNYIQPRVFLSLNYGNLALEMYDPMWIPKTIYENPRGVKATREQVKNWAYTYLRIKRLTQRNYDLVYRAYLSFDRFRWWLMSDKTRKEYRHFEHFLSLPGIMAIGGRSYARDSSKIPERRRPGVIFIVLEITATNELKVRCPSYPTQNEVLATSDIGFLFHHYTGIWEPIFYYDNKALIDGELNQSYLTFSGYREDGLTEEKFPPIIRKRIDEFRSQCSSITGGLGIYTSSSGIKSTRIAPLTSMKKMLTSSEEVQLYGFIRDSYNHLAALVFKLESSGLIAVPVIDDGLSFIDLEYKLIMDWDDYEPAPIEQVYAFYKKYVEPLFPHLYTVRTAIKNKATQRIEAIQLSNGLYVPVAPVADAPTLVFPDSESPRLIDEMEWSINRKIVTDSVSTPEQLDKTSRLRLKEFNESFEYLRITFSNWLNSREEGSDFRNELEEIIFSRDYLLFEKRKRLEIKLGPVIEKWIAESDETAPRQISIFRKDCSLLGESDCTGMCSWKSMAEEGSTGKCLIHVAKKSPNSTTTKEGIETVHAPGGEILLRRLIEELLRFGNRRKQLFNKTVSEIATLDGPIRDKDQYIIPEKSYVWTEMLRLDWTKQENDAPKYMEEMVKEPSGPEVPQALAPLNELSTIPATVASILDPTGKDPVFPRLRLYPSPTGTLAPFLALFKATEADIAERSGLTMLDDKILTKLIRFAQIPVLQINLQENGQMISRRAPRDRYHRYAILVIKEDGTPALVVTDPEAPALLQMGDLPSAVKGIFEDKTRTKVVFVAGHT